MPKCLKIAVAPFTLLVRMRQTVSFRVISARLHSKGHFKQTQSPLQRGFTKASSSINCSLILEEYIRESKDMIKDVYIVFLAAKSAFDVVDHASLM